MSFSIARQRFYQEIHQPDAQIDLARAALYLAQEEYPDLDAEEYLNALDTMAMDVTERLTVERYPLRIIKTINQYLYQDLGFCGNAANYYDPPNSYLNQVIERRTGIPITLSLVYLEIAQRIDFPMRGVNFPGHFLIRPTLAEMEVFVDPFNQGDILFVTDCQERLQQIYGESVQFESQFLETVSPKQFLARLLGNLKIIYLNQGDLQRSLAAIERILLLFPNALKEVRDRGLLFYQLGRWRDASRDLETYLIQAPLAEDAEVILKLLQRISMRG
jgi:regulator of sirC expression with transglutaminase-like and TPR domain